MKSIRGQLTLWILAGFALLLVGSSAAIYCFTRLGMLREFDAGLHAKAMMMMSWTQQDEHGVKLDLPDSFSDERNGNAMPGYFELWQTNGTVLARSKSLQNSDLPLRPALGENGGIWDFQLPNGRAGRAMCMRFTPSAEDEEKGRFQPGEAVLVVAVDRTALDKTLFLLAMVLLVTVTVSLLMTVPIVRWSLRRGHSPLDALAVQAAAINADSLGTRFPVAELPEELKPIAARLNDLLARLEKSFERERRFTADLAHELRTPLSELRLLAEVEVAWPEGKDTEKFHETLGIAIQMETLVTRLLELVRSENGRIPLKMETVSVAKLVDEVWLSQATKAKEKRLSVKFDVPQGTSLKTDRALFQAILRNLLSNSVEYTPPEGKIIIRCQADPFVMSFSNTVQDLEAADIPHIFERLWRKDKSRTGGEHFGLGLALSRSYAQLLGLHLKAELSAGNTLIISLEPQA